MNKNVYVISGLDRDSNEYFYMQDAFNGMFLQNDLLDATLYTFDDAYKIKRRIAREHHLYPSITIIRIKVLMLAYTNDSGTFIN